MYMGSIGLVNEESPLLLGPVFVFGTGWSLSVGFVLVLCACPSLPVVVTGSLSWLMGATAPTLPPDCPDVLGLKPAVLSSSFSSFSLQGPDDKALPFHPSRDRGLLRSFTEVFGLSVWL